MFVVVLICVGSIHDAHLSYTMYSEWHKHNNEIMNKSKVHHIYVIALLKRDERLRCINTISGRFNSVTENEIWDEVIFCTQKYVPNSVYIFVNGLFFNTVST